MNMNAGQLRRVIVLGTWMSLVDDAAEAFRQREMGRLRKLADKIAETPHPYAIPTLIGIIEADNSYDTVYWVGYFGLKRMTGVDYSSFHDGAWWRRWWMKNKSRFPKEVQDLTIPEFPKTEHGKTHRPYADAWWRKWWEDNKSRYPDRARQNAIPDYRNLLAERDRVRELAQRRDALQDVADVPAQDLLVGDDKKKRYFLIGPSAGVAAPRDGYKLVVVMPGGDGGPDFHPFVRRIYRHALNDSFLIAQPVAFKWQANQRIVWPTRNTPVDKQQFATEDFVEDVVHDVRRQFPLNARHIFTLSWSSSGPAAYAISLAENKSVTGSYVAMSVFKPEHLPPLRFADGHVYTIDHSREDRVCPFRMAETARQSLEENGATVQFNTYVGGHGWQGDVYGRIRSGIEWLEQQTAAMQNIQAP